MTDTTSSPLSDQMAGHLLVECLIAQGVTHAFGVPGESYLAVLDGFHHYRDQIQFVTCRQEGGAAYMADAQGRLTGRPGVCFVTRGPACHWPHRRPTKPWAWSPGRPYARRSRHWWHPDLE